MTLINAKWRKKYFPVKEINLKEVQKFQNEGNKLTWLHKETELVETTGTNLL